MKTLIALIATFSAASAMACPQINGTFACEYSSGTENTTFATHMDGSTTVYVVDGAEARADGVAKTFENGDGSKTVLTLTCDENNLNLHSVVTGVDATLGQVVCGDSGLDHVEANTTWAINGDTLTQKAVGNFVCNDKTSIPGEGNITCKKVSSSTTPTVVRPLTHQLNLN